MIDQELFEKLKREGECWHELDQHVCEEWQIPMCTKCGQDIGLDNWHWEYPPDTIEVRIPNRLDLTTPDGFFWLWERAQEKEWWGEFYWTVLHCFDSEYIQRLDSTLINPPRFRDALKEFFNETT